MYIEQSSKYLQGMYKVILTMLDGNLESFLAKLYLCNNLNKTPSKNIFSNLCHKIPAVSVHE